MRLIVGVDTRHRSQGAMRFAVWLHGHLRGQPVELVGHHVLEHDEVMALLRRRHLTEVLEDAAAQVRQTVEEAGASALLGDAEVVQAMRAEDHLADALGELAADALVIGRSAARQDDARLVRLGRVARRLARALPGPVVVVPPDLEASQIGSGPVVCAAAPHRDCVDAAKRTMELATGLGRECVLLHALRLPEPMRGDGSSPSELAQLEHTAAKARLEAFAVHHGLQAARLEVVVGEPELVVPERVRQLQAPMVVCGSRRLTLAQRLFTSSLGTYLACQCETPVMIVPPQ